MKSIAKLTRRFVGILSLSMFLLLVVNFILLLAIASTQTPGIGPWTTASETEAALKKTETGYILSDEMAETLEAENAWAVYIDNETKQVLWHTEDLPAEIPMQYTIADISSLGVSGGLSHLYRRIRRRAGGRGISKRPVLETHEPVLGL